MIREAKEILLALRRCRRCTVFLVLNIENSEELLFLGFFLLFAEIIDSSDDSAYQDQD